MDNVNSVTAFEAHEELTRVDPFTNPKLFREFIVQQFVCDWAFEPGTRRDISEGNTAYAVKVELSRVNKEGIEESIEGTQLAVCASRVVQEEPVINKRMQSCFGTG